MEFLKFILEMLITSEITDYLKILTELYFEFQILYVIFNNTILHFKYNLISKQKNKINKAAAFSYAYLI